MISLGCPKNLVDSEGIVSDFLSHGIEVVVDPADADLVVVNTCGFLGSAREESLNAIRSACALKADGLKAVFVTGCMVGNYAKEIHAAVPDIDRLIDFKDYARLPEMIDEIIPDVNKSKTGFVRPGNYVQARLTPAHFAYLKISEGCNHNCTFCVIPSIRGRMRSLAFDDVLDKARRLVQVGAKEINVVAQDSTQYGIDLYGKRRIAELMQSVSETDGLHWTRLLYAYPTEVDDDLIEILAADNKVLPYLDVPLQHSSGRVLERMRRQSSEKQVEDLLLKLRSRAPDLVIRTTFIVGFPGETDADFEHLMRFVDRHRIDRLGAFPYSPEPGSPAFDLEDAVPEELKQERLDRLMTLQRGIAEENNARFLGRDLEILVEDPGIDDGKARGRSFADAPEIDGSVHLTGRAVAPGELVQARVTETSAYDLEATII